MKTRVLTALLAFTLCCIGAQAQSFRIDWVGSDTVYFNPDSGVVYHHANLVNTSSTVTPIVFTFNLSGLYLDHYVGLCFGALCYDLNDSTTDPDERAPYVMPVGHTEDLKVQLTTLRKKATSRISFTLMNADVRSERITYTAVFIPGSPASVTDVSTLGDVRVGPLPATGNVTITGQAMEAITGVSLYSSNGNILRTYAHDGSNTVNIDTDGLASGVYHAILSDATGSLYRSTINVVR